MKNPASKVSGTGGAKDMSAVKKVAMGTSKSGSPEAGAKIEKDWVNHKSIESNSKDC